jgi:hypothetical protein
MPSCPPWANLSDVLQGKILYLVVDLTSGNDNGFKKLALLCKRLNTPCIIPKGLFPTLKFCLLSQFAVLVFAHLLFPPLYNTPHKTTSFINSKLKSDTKTSGISRSYILLSACFIWFAWSIKASSCISVVGDSVPS